MGPLSQLLQLVALDECMHLQVHFDREERKCLVASLSELQIYISIAAMGDHILDGLICYHTSDDPPLVAKHHPKVWIHLS